MQGETRRKQGRRIAVIIAATGLSWILVQIVGAALGVSQKVMVLFDMLAGVGFVMALWLSYQMRASKKGHAPPSGRTTGR